MMGLKLMLLFSIHLSAVVSTIVSDSFHKISDSLTRFQSLNVIFTRSSKIKCAAICKEMSNDCFSFIYVKEMSYCELGAFVVPSATPRDMVVDLYQSIINAGEYPCYENVTTLTMFASCAGTANLVSNVTATVNSPNYPASYDNNMNCTWLVSVPCGFVLQLYFTAYTFECCCDYIHIHDGISGFHRMLATNCTPPVMTFQTSSNSMFLIFITDYSIVYTGFQAIITLLTRYT